ncbi:hypothetical protein LOTGIDRAFT_230466 [Lottia gigantea]|uniref:C2H2-type domain-containing protein n=1 Tax=Lottia gigantea TaxID=225164 RepID=V4B662_LOTGI|nr:hypothetical protein LOTGIDRAFT_230466 [Lottia gigantea]ESP03026.1 hypothetical protein LOTGIDRAFT_230466 [Lottia gigantea]
MQERKQSIKMGDSEKHQCRVCDMIFHSYEELERHCLIHIENDNPATRPNSEIVSTFAIGTSAKSVVDSKDQLNSH